MKANGMMKDWNGGSRSFRDALPAVVLLAASWLGGCSPSSATALRSESHKVCLLEVTADYATVHDRILQRARHRYVFPGVPRLQPGVTGGLSPETESSTITLWDSGGVGIRYRLAAEVHAIDSTHTRVELYAAGKSDRQEARLWAIWAETPLEDNDSTSPSHKEEPVAPQVKP